MIEINNLHLTFNKGEANEVNVLRGINLEIKAQEFVVLVGANGSGKSSLLNALAGTVTPDKGTIKIEGKDITHLKEYERSKFLSRIFQNPLQGTAPDLSILDNFRLASLRTQSKHLHIGINQNFKDLVREKIRTLNLGLEDKWQQPMGTLSGGQRQALTLLMATMDDCKIMFLDEPTAALDPKSSAIVMEKANEIISTNHLTALLITHQLKDALKYGNRILMMEEGVISKDIHSEEKSFLKMEELFGWF